MMLLWRQRAELGLDKPFLTQYFTWLGSSSMATWDAVTFQDAQSFETFIAKASQRFCLPGVCRSHASRITAARCFSAVNQNRWGDWVIRSLSFVGNSIPNFFAALLLLYIFAIQLQWLPVISRQLTVEA